MSAKNRKGTEAQVETLCKKVNHFSKTEIDSLIKHFNALLAKQVSPAEAAHGLDRATFRRILRSDFRMTNTMIMEGVIRSFDENGDGIISLEEWIKGLSVLLRGTLDEKIKHCFKVYDLNDDKYIAKEEIGFMLKGCFNQLPNEEDRDEAVKELVEMAMKMLDYDRDGKLSFQDFQKSVRKQNLLLEAFGNCLPDPMSIEKFERLVFQEQGQ